MKINNNSRDFNQASPSYPEKMIIAARATDLTSGDESSSNSARMVVSNSVTPKQSLEKDNGVRKVDNSDLSISRKELVLSILDPLNKRIVGMLEENAFLSQTEIAKELDLSQSSVAIRLDRLRKSGILVDSIGLNLKEIGLEICRVDADCSDPRAVLEWAKLCPVFVNGFLSVGLQNVSLYFAAEDMEMFQFIVDQHIRHLPGVSLVRFSPIVHWGKDFTAPLKLDVQSTESPPCGLFPYCPKCPANPAYDGKIWNSEE